MYFFISLAGSGVPREREQPSPHVSPFSPSYHHHNPPFDSDFVRPQLSFYPTSSYVIPLSSLTDYSISRALVSLARTGDTLYDSASFLARPRHLSVYLETNLLFSNARASQPVQDMPLVEFDLSSWL
jgi:hypothetical protein